MKGPNAETHKVKLDKIGKCKKLPATIVPAWKFPERVLTRTSVLALFDFTVTVPGLRASNGKQA